MLRPSALSEDDSYSVAIYFLVCSVFLFVILCLDETTPPRKRIWERATLSEVQSGKFEIKTGGGMRGGIEYYKKVR